MNYLKKFKAVLFVLTFLSIGIGLGYFYILYDIQKKPHTVSYEQSAFRASPEYGEIEELHFKIENASTNPELVDLYWLDIENEYPEDSLSYTLEYKEEDASSWTQVGTYGEFIPSLKIDEYPLAENLVIDANATYQFKLVIKNVSYKVDPGEISLDYRIDFRKRKKEL